MRASLAWHRLGARRREGPRRARTTQLSTRSTLEVPSGWRRERVNFSKPSIVAMLQSYLRREERRGAAVRYERPAAPARAAQRVHRRLCRSHGGEGSADAVAGRGPGAHPSNWTSGLISLSVLAAASTLVMPQCSGRKKRRFMFASSTLS